MNFLPQPHSRGSGPAAWDKAIQIANLPPGRLAGGLAAMTIRACVRVSTADQRCELQVRELREHAERQGWQLADIYEDMNSAAKTSRPALNRLIADARARKLDCLLVWKLDRFGRSLVDCLNNIKILKENDFRFISVTQGLDTDLQNPASRFLLHMLGAAAEFERR